VSTWEILKQMAIELARVRSMADRIPMDPEAHILHYLIDMLTMEVESKAAAHANGKINFNSQIFQAANSNAESQDKDVPVRSKLKSEPPFGLTQRRGDKTHARNLTGLTLSHLRVLVAPIPLDARQIHAGDHVGSLQPAVQVDVGAAAGAERIKF
jgi:hypothetical protein